MFLLIYTVVLQGFKIKLRPGFVLCNIRTFSLLKPYYSQATRLFCYSLIFSCAFLIVCRYQYYLCWKKEPDKLLYFSLEVVSDLSCPKEALGQTSLPAVETISLRCLGRRWQVADVRVSTQAAAQFRFIFPRILTWLHHLQWCLLWFQSCANMPPLFFYYL